MGFCTTDSLLTFIALLICTHKAELEGAGATGNTTTTSSATPAARLTEGTQEADVAGDHHHLASTSAAGEVAGSLSPRLALAQLKAIGDDLGPGSVDWRLATPQMAKSLSQHLCDAFFTSCCVLLPAFSYYREKMPQYHGEKDLPSSTKVGQAAHAACAKSRMLTSPLGCHCFLLRRGSPRFSSLGAALRFSDK